MRLTEIQELGCHALAVVQAAAYIRHFEWELHRYVKEYRRSRGRLLEEYSKLTQRSGEYNLTTFTTWRISYEKLGPESRIFLQLCSYLQYEGIYEWIFEMATVRSMNYEPDAGFEELGREAGQRLRDFLRLFLTNDCIWDTLQFHQVVNELKSYSLLQFDSRNRS